MNINSAINEGSKFLRSKFIPNSYLDSEILMALTISKDRNYILLNPTKVLKKIELINYYNLIKQRSLGNPVAYLTKEVFWDSDFVVSQRYFDTKTRYGISCRKYITLNKT